jgi:hypothetical protein
MSFKPPDKSVKGGLTLTIVAPKQVVIEDKDLAEDLNISLGKGFSLASSIEQILEENLQFDLRNIFFMLLYNERLYLRVSKVLTFMYSVLKEEGIINCRFSPLPSKEGDYLMLHYDHPKKFGAVTIHQDRYSINDSTILDISVLHEILRKEIKWLAS